jgi:cell pole-organizing protein PopZ
MGDVSAEPSMEDILASIKRIIAEDAENGAPLRARRRPAPPPPVDDFVDDDDVLELSEQAPAPAPVVAEPEPVQLAAAEPVAAAAPVVAEPIAEPAPMPMSPPVTAAPEPVVAPSVAEKPETIVSPQTAEASRAPLDTLSRLVVKPETAGADTLEGMVREMLRPMLSDWLDRNLPDLVESMVAKEIARITGGR